MSVLGEAVVRIRADSAGVVEESKLSGHKAGAAFAAAFNKGSAGSGANVKKEIGQAERGAVAGSAAFTHLGRSLAFASGAFLGTAKAVDIVRGAIHSASDEQKQLERAGGLFGQSLGRVKEFSTQAATSLGLSSGAAIKFSNDIGQMLGPLKITKDRTAAVSIEMVKLVGNLSSLRNEDPSVVMSKVSSALRGRGAALRAYGIDVSATALKEEALRSGIVKSQVDTTKLALARDQVRIKTAQAAVALHDYGKGTTQYQGALDAIVTAQRKYEKALAGAVPGLTQQQRQQAALNIVLREGGKYQGEFSKHSGDLANKSRILHAELSNLQTELGQALLPTVTKVADVMVKWLSNSQNQARVQRDIKTAVHDFTVGLQFAYVWTKRFVDIMGGLGDTIKILLAYKIGSWAADILGPALSRASAAWKSVGTAATESATATTVATTKMKQEFQALQLAGAPTAVAKQISGIGTASTVASTKVGLLRTGLGRLGRLGKIAIPVSIVTQVIDPAGSPWNAAVQGGLLGLLFGGPEVAIAAAAASVALNVIVNYIAGKGTPEDPWHPGTDTVTQPGHVPPGFATKVPIRTFKSFGGKNAAGTYAYLVNRIAEDWVSGATVEDIRRVYGRLGYPQRMLENAISHVINDPSINAARRKNLRTQAHETTVAAVAAGAGDIPATATPTQKRQLGAVLGFAKKFGPGSGITYHWGGVKPETGFDCSGFLYAAYAAAGIKIPRTAHDQFYDKNAIDVTGQERPGDGVYFTGTASGRNTGPPPRHCGIAIGGGKFIEYFWPGHPARISYLGDRKDYSGARRWIKVLGDVATSSPTDTAPAATPPPTTTGSGVLTVGVKAANQVLGVGLVDALAAAKRKVTAAKGGPVNVLEAAIQNEIAVDRKIIAAAQEYARTHPKMVRQAHKIIAAAQDDIVRLGGEVGKAILGEGFSADALAAAKRAVTLTKGGPINVYAAAIQAEINVDRHIIAQAEAFARSHHNMTEKVRRIIQRAKDDIARLTVVRTKAVTKAETHEALVRQVVLGLGLPDSVLATRAIEVIEAAYEKMSDAALRAKLRQQQKLKAQLAGIPVAYVDICDYCAEVCQDSKRAAAVAAGTTDASGGGRPGARGGHPNERSRPPDVPGHPGARRSQQPERSRPPDAGPLTHADRQRTQHAREQAHRDNASLRVARESRGHLASIDRKLTPPKGAGASAGRESAKNLLPS